jgi:hypothetical protein
MFRRPAKQVHQLPNLTYVPGGTFKVMGDLNCEMCSTWNGNSDMQIRSAEDLLAILFAQAVQMTSRCFPIRLDSIAMLAQVRAPNSVVAITDGFELFCA